MTIGSKICDIIIVKSQKATAYSVNQAITSFLPRLCRIVRMVLAAVVDA
jgi:hypothetical protein